MDTLPPLSRSPASPPNSYCSSEVSSLGYPSPTLGTQQHRLPSFLGETAASSCSMAPPLDPEALLGGLDNLGQPEWSQNMTIQTCPTSHSMDTGMASSYDASGVSGPSISVAYNSNLYTMTRNPGTPSPGLSHTGTHVLPSSRSPLSFASHPAPVPPPHGELEAALPDYGRIARGSQFPSPPQPVQVPYGAGNSENMPGEYLADCIPAAWGQVAVAAESLFPASGGGFQRSAHSMIQPMAQPVVTEHQQLRAGKQQRPCRRLTTKEEANFRCEVEGCGKLFSRSYNYKAHMETHDEKREYPFPCQVPDCNKKFVRKTDLQRHHQSVHAKERNHRCDYCGRLFARKDTLRRHMDDGCSKRFDIGTLDLRSVSYGSPAGSAQEGFGVQGPREVPY